MAFNIGPYGGGASNRIKAQQPSRRPNYGRPMMQSPMGPASGARPFGIGPMPTPNRGGGMPVSSPMPVNKPMPFLGGEGGIGTPGQQPLEENQLWRTYNRLLGGQMAPRMLL